MPLTDTAIRKAKPADKPVKLFDGGGMYLLIAPTGAKGWRLKYRYHGKEKLLSLGIYPDVSLKEAREKRDAARKSLAAGSDPSTVRQSESLAKRLATTNTFEAVAREWLKMKSASLAKPTADKARVHLEQHAFPVIGHRGISELAAPDYLLMLRKIEKRIPYTATRVRELCSQICRYAIATGRLLSNPVADLRGALTAPKATHRPAITDRRGFAEFLQSLKGARMGPVTRAATRFAMLTFVRSSEFRYAKWEEIDEKAAEWRIPGERMKMGKGLQAHLVPLARQTLALLEDLKPLTGQTPYLFPNAHGADGVISENTVGKALNDLGYQGKQCAHGFRATARSLLAEQGWNREAMERQLDHAERSKVVAAYARAEHLDERKAMMQGWADMIDALESGAEVIPIRKSKAAA